MYRQLASLYLGRRMHPFVVDAAYPALRNRHRFGIQTVLDVETLRIATDSGGGGLGKIVTTILACSGNGSSGPVEQHVVVANQIGQRADRVQPSPADVVAASPHWFAIRVMMAYPAILIPEFFGSTVVKRR